jgi:hypothetical protein
MKNMKVYSRDDLNYIACLIDRGNFISVTINNQESRSTGVRMTFALSNKEFCVEFSRAFPGHVAQFGAKKKSDTNLRDIFMYQMYVDEIRNLVPQVLPYLRVERQKKACKLIIEFLDMRTRGIMARDNVDYMQKKFDLALEIRDIISGGWE